MLDAPAQPDDLRALEHWPLQHQHPFHGGFLAWGAMVGSPGPDPHQLAVAALPDERTTVVLEYRRGGESLRPLQTGWIGMAGVVGLYGSEGPRLDCGRVVLSGASVAQTAAVAENVRVMATDFDAARAVLVPGADGRQYLLTVNFGDTEQFVEIMLPEHTAAVVDLVNRRDWWRMGETAGMRLRPGEAIVAEVIV